MAEARSRLGWAQTAGIIAMVANTARDRKRKPSPFTPDDFDPWARSDARTRRVRAGIEVLKVFVKEKRT